MSSEENEQLEIKLLIPIFFLLMTIASMIGIVANSFLLGTSTTSDFNTSGTVPMGDGDKIVKIVVSSIFTLIFLLVTIFLFVEVLKPDNYEPRLITPKFDVRLKTIVRNIESFEIMFLVFLFFTYPVGLGLSLVNNKDEVIILSALLTAILMYTYTTRTGLRDSIRKTLKIKTVTDLTELSLVLGKDARRIKKQLVYMITFEQFPATFDFQTEQINYDDKLTDMNTTHAVVIEENKSVKQNIPNITQIKKPICDYCGVEALVNNAKFCSDCGASIMPAK